MAVPKIWRRIPELYNLIGSKCNECDSLYFPSRDVCRECSSIKLKEHKFEGKGQVVTFTVVRTQISDPENELIEIPARETPYVLAIIKLDEGPMLTSEIVDSKPEDVEIGDNVEVAFRKINEHGKKGVIQYGYKFKKRWF